MSSFSPPCPLPASPLPMWSSSIYIVAASRPCWLMKTSSRIAIGGVPTRRTERRVWQILSQWVWNLRQDLRKPRQPTSMRLTEFSPPRTDPLPSRTPSPAGPAFGPPQWARAARVRNLGGHYFLPQADGTLRCPQGATLYPQERRPEH